MRALKKRSGWPSISWYHETKCNLLHTKCFSSLLLSPRANVKAFVACMKSCTLYWLMYARYISLPSSVFPKNAEHLCSLEEFPAIGICAAATDYLFLFKRKKAIFEDENPRIPFLLSHWNASNVLLLPLILCVLYVEVVFLLSVVV